VTGASERALPEVVSGTPRHLPGDAVLAPSRGFVLGLIAAVILSLFLGVLLGRGGILDFSADSVLLEMRANRAFVAFLCGGALSVAGAVVQTLFRNPLASPQILGTTSGATLGAHLALVGSVMLLRGSGVLGIAPEMLIPIGATVGASVSLFLLLAVISLREEPLALLLTGFALMSLFQGASTFLMSVNQEAWELNRAFAALNQGDISAAGPRQVLLVLVMTIGGVVPVLASSSTLDVLVSSDDEARTLGVDVGQVRFWLVLWVAILTAGAVAVGGSVGFIGLIAPHALRPWVGQRHRYLVPAAFAGGGCFVVLCDVLCRIVPMRSGIPVGVLIDLVGAPIFLWLLIRYLRAQADHG
jgi:iron complex transport system permease protein